MMLKQSFFKRIILLILASLAIYACSDNDDGQNTICGVTDPTEELKWLKTEITLRKRDVSENAKYYYISQAELDGKTVFLYLDCDSKANTAPSVYDCEGMLLGAIGKEFTLEEFTNHSDIFVPLNFECQSE
ncbi:hypothetical protein [Maribacter halichondriae]|uniref:hypothetical protein n=1 Tax=Maribacter halichondriae TaxID=2980554 RepID=UPI00235A34BA|nr:hypothetical protein [Maribacter sp. Hal144]